MAAAVAALMAANRKPASPTPHWRRRRHRIGAGAGNGAGPASGCCSSGAGASAGGGAGGCGVGSRAGLSKAGGGRECCRASARGAPREQRIFGLGEVAEWAWAQAEPRQGADEGERGLESEGTRHFPSPAARLNLTLTRNMLRAFADPEYAAGQNR